MNGKVASAYEALDKAAATIVNEPGLTWQDKRDQLARWIRANSSSELQQVISWFTDEMEE